MSAPGSSAGLGASPFPCDRSAPRVVVSSLPDAYGAARQAVTAFDICAARGRRVLVKPNAGRIATPGQGITTSPAVVAAVIDAFLEAGAEVAVGESPITGVKTLEALASTGIATVAQERGARLIDLDERKPLKVEIPGGRAITTLSVCTEVLEHDIIVSVPVMKTHMHTGVTLAVKNMKGCLWRRTKVDLHMLPRIEDSPEKPLNVAIADMARVLTPHFSVIDGSCGMEGLGPSAGTAKSAGVVVAGVDAFAADAVACALMGTSAEAVPHLRLGAANGCGTIDLSRIRVTPETWRALTVPFAPPPENLAIEFPGVEVRDEQSCSGCQSTLLLFLKRHGDSLRDYFPDGIPVRIAIGKGHESLPQGTLCIGNCTVKHKGQGTFVPGCPPVASQILKALQDSTQS